MSVLSWLCSLPTYLKGPPFPPVMCMRLKCMTFVSARWKAVCPRNIRTSRNLKSRERSMTSSSPRGWKLLPIPTWMYPSTKVRRTIFPLSANHWKDATGSNWFETLKSPIMIWLSWGPWVWALSRTVRSAP